MALEDLYNITGKVTDVSGSGLEITVELVFPFGISDFLYPQYVDSGFYNLSAIPGTIIEFVLVGDEVQKIRLNSEFTDFGARAKFQDDLGNIFDISSYIERFGNIVSDKSGKYILTYKIDFFGATSEITRTIFVEEFCWIECIVPEPYLESSLINQIAKRFCDIYFELNAKIDHARFGFDTTRQQEIPWTPDFDPTSFVVTFDAAIDINIIDDKVLLTNHPFKKFDLVELSDEVGGGTFPGGLPAANYVIFSTTRDSIKLGVEGLPDGLVSINITSVGVGILTFKRIDLKVALTEFIYLLRDASIISPEEPGTPRGDWDTRVSYIEGDIVQFGVEFYFSTTSGNIANIPTSLIGWKLSDWIPQFDSQRIGNIDGDLAQNLARSFGIPDFIYFGLLKSINDRRTITEIFKLLIETRGTEKALIAFLRLVQEGFVGSFELDQQFFAAWSSIVIYDPLDRVSHIDLTWEAVNPNVNSEPMDANPNWIRVLDGQLRIERISPEEVTQLDLSEYLKVLNGDTFEDVPKSKWDVTITYETDDGVYLNIDGDVNSPSNAVWISLIDTNLGNNPATSPAEWKKVYDITFQDGDNSCYRIILGSLGLTNSNTEKEQVQVVGLVQNALKFFVPDYIKFEAELTVPLFNLTNYISEGLITVDIADEARIDDVGYNIISVDQGTPNFAIQDDQTAIFNLGTSIFVDESTGNDGFYTIVSVIFSAPATLIEVLESIPDATVDGILGLSKQIFSIIAVTTGVGGVFTLTGDFTAHFGTGTNVEVEVSTGNDAVYTISSISLVLGNTEITVVENVLDATADGLIGLVKP